MQISVMQPGLLVSLKTSVRGGVEYRRVDLETEHRTESGEVRARWETERVITNPDDYEKARDAQSRARSIIVAQCCSSSFGLLCPVAREQELDLAIAEARAVAQGHNAASGLTQVEVYVLVGRIAQSDQEAARAIAAEVRGLLDQMAQGVKQADPEAIREAANKARQLGAVLSEDVNAKVGEAIKEARRAAREIVAKVEKAGEAAADVVSRCSVEKIAAARMAFLDMDEGEAVAVSVAGRKVDLPAGDVEASPIMALPLEVS